MESQESLNFQRIATAIEYIQENFKLQPSLDEVAAKVNLSPFHFQKLFTDWAGTSPKKFLQYISIAYAKSLIHEQHTTLFDVAEETGLSSTSRLHDLFVNIEGMTPAEYRDGGTALQIDYHFADSHFGKILIASTAKGICHLAFCDQPEWVLERLQKQFPKAIYNEAFTPMQKEALKLFNPEETPVEKIKLHLKGTSFQLKVWEALLKIPLGELSTYGKIAKAIESPKASRAVGTAIGDNPIAFLIPCHRVIQSSGVFGGYMWNPIRKTAIIGWEGAQVEK